MALLGLAAHTETDQRRRTALLMVGLAGAALFYGDGMITPAISVLSAVEGLEVAAPLLKPYVIPVTVAVLIGLFVVQSRGSERIGAYFGPIMALWFAVLAIAGLVQVVRDPGVVAGKRGKTPGRQDYAGWPRQRMRSGRDGTIGWPGTESLLPR